MESNNFDSKEEWSRCAYCQNINFNAVADFVGHLREKHCIVEGGSFTCRYGYNAVCNSLPVEGVNDLDYSRHVVKHHARLNVISHHAEPNIEKRRKSYGSGQSNAPSETDGSWTLLSAKQNLATVLNDPNRGKQKDYFTKYWGLDFVEKTGVEIPKHPYLPDISHCHFETYLKKIAKRQKRHLRLSEEVSPKLDHSTSSDVLQIFPKLRLRKILSNERRSYEKPDISPIFLQADFEMSDAETFFSIFPFSKNDKPENEIFQHRKLMQEKLTHDLDQVEVLIAEQVSQKSDAFFQAMTSHDSLMDQLDKTLSVVRSLRQKIFLIDKCLAKRCLHLLRLHQRKYNHVVVLQKLKLMGTVQQTQPTIQALLSAPDYLAALELIATTQELLNEELHGIHSFRHLGSQLNEINRLIDMMMMTEFENYLIRDLNRNSMEDFQLSEKEKLTSIMLGMLRRRNVQFILKYKEEMFTTIRTVVKQSVFEALAENDFDIDGPYSTEKIHLLSLDEWIELINKIARNLLKLLHGVEVVVDIMKDSVRLAVESSKTERDAGNEEEAGFLTEKEYKNLMGDLKDLSSSICNFSHDECAKILMALAKNKPAREKVSVFEDVDGKQICRLSVIIEDFASESEKLCSGKCSSSLKSAFQHQANKFLNKFHNDRKCRLNSALENESWRPKEVGEGFQNLINSVYASGILSADSTRSVRWKKSENCLTVNEEKFVIVGSVVVLVETVVEYLDTAKNLPLLSTNVLRNVCELLSHYNSKSCQLILGAGALQTVGLKTITTTNLVLTSRSLQLILWLMPCIKKSLQTFAKTVNLNLLNEVEVNIKDHVDKLHAKVVLVVGSVITNEITNWAAKPPVPSSSFRNISKHLSKLHEAVAGILPSSQIQDLYKNIHNVFKGSLREQLKKLNIVNNGGPQHGTVTSELIFYLEMLKKLQINSSENFFDRSLDDIWSSK